MKNSNLEPIEQRNDICDEIFIRNIAAGDKDSLSILYERYSGRVYPLAYMLLENSADAEDLMCDVFIEAWNNAKNYKPEKGSFLSWLLLICRSRAIDFLRKKKVRQEKHAIILSQDDAEIINEPESCLMFFQENSIVRQGMETLSEQQQLAIFLSYYKGYSHNEISELLSLPLGTVKTNISRGLKKLKHHFEEATKHG